MRLLVCCWILICPTLALAQSPASSERAVRELVRKYVEAREHQSPKEIGALFLADADQLVSSGEWRKGREAVVEGTMKSSKQTGGSRSITVESVRLLSPDVAIADGHYDLSGLAGGKTRHMWTSIVAVRASDGWKIAAIRNMLPAPPAPVK